MSILFFGLNVDNKESISSIKGSILPKILKVPSISFLLYILYNYEIFVHPERRELENALLVPAIRLQMELKLIASAPYNIIYLDG
jgi:hypothetical protein